MMPSDADPPSRTELAVPEDQAGRRLLAFLASMLPAESKAALRRLVGSGDITVNGARVSTGAAVRSGDVVTLPEGLAPGPPPPARMELSVIHEDEDLLCLDKPAGVPVLPARDGTGAELRDSLLAHVNRDAPPGGPYRRPHLVHRLDRDTSGVLLVAKTLQASRALSRQFQERRVKKGYLAVAEGVLPQSELTVEVAVGRRPGSVVAMRADPGGGKPARTELAVRERFGHFCLLDVRPLTGRQHQIRVHLSAIGYPLAVDGLYGRRSELAGAGLNAILARRAVAPRRTVLARTPLHAASIAYAHPRTGEPAAHSAPLPDDLEELLGLLRRHDPAP
jgi:23S rRNA pseudouridine1911/1915/1917 synthase